MISKSAEISGQQVPSGVVKVSGAKNSATRLLAAALISDSTIELLNFPSKLVDIQYNVQFIEKMGGQVHLNHATETAIIKSNHFESKILDDYNYPIRTTYLLTAGQIKKSGVARIPYPGGCKIGSRGYDLHIMVWEQLGCKVRELEDHIEIRGNEFKGCKIKFPISTVGGTENALLCSAIAKGRTEITNAYVTPEVEDLIELLRRMGANITVFGNSMIVVEGRDYLHSASMHVMPDRIEALTWVVYAIVSGGDIIVQDIPYEAMDVPLIHIEKAGVDLFCNSNSIYVSKDCLTSGSVQPFELASGTYPGIISDMQPFFVLLGLVANGTSRIFDYRYPKRIVYIDELKKFCVNKNVLDAQVGRITTHGPTKFSGAKAMSTDLRGSMALLLAALCAEEKSTILDVHMALRGYNKLEEKLTQLGISITVFDSK